MIPYLVHIYIAAPGTPLKLDPYGTSTPGHMFYVIEHGAEKKSYGLAPIKHGDFNGPGKVYPDDVDNYHNPLYQRTLEITQVQYQQLKDFGSNPLQFGFRTYYADVRNNCVDFVWKALDVAGLNATITVPAPVTPTNGAKRVVPRIHYEGRLKPTHNIRDVQSIQAPFPNSTHNREKRNAMPARDFKQWLLSENNHAASARRRA
jgi:hypothetical protein